MNEQNKGRMIPLHIADMAVAVCNAEITKLLEENARLKAQVETLQIRCEKLERKTDEK